MNTQKTAILVDSCCDVPKAIVEKYGMYVVPLKIIYKDKEFMDGVDITPEEVYQGLSVEIPKTSLPSGDQIVSIFDQIKADGYEKVIAVTLSSGLSGTNNIITLVATSYEGLDFFVFDTKNIAIGAGFHAIQAARYLEEGLTFSEIISKLEKGLKKSKLFFVVSTLEYLQKGGRIGLVASLFGNALNLKPIISCNDEGIYYTVAKVRGRKQSLSKALELADKFLGDHKKYNLAVINGDASEAADEVRDILRNHHSDAEVFVEGQISPALGVHTGPGAIGIAIQLLDEE